MTAAFDSGDYTYSRWNGQKKGIVVERAQWAIKIGSFSLRRPEAETFFGGWVDESEQILLGALSQPAWFENEAKAALREKIFFNRDTTLDFSTWLSENRKRVIWDWTEGSADYLTDYLIGMTKEGAQRLGFVRNIEWDYQSALGERRWQTGLSALGAFRETADDAIVWQLRGFAAEDSSAGANVGLIYRRAVDEALVGANVFFDYEQFGEENEDFLRWSFGLELRSAWLDVYANRYEAMTDGKLMDEESNEYLYSQSGYDAEIRLHAPGQSWLSGGLTYYHWEGEYGADDETGVRYHLALNSLGSGSLWGGLKLELEVDSPEEGGIDWGGQISYRYIFGVPASGGSVYTKTHFDPREHFFTAVRREYSQRIKYTENATGQNVVAELGAGAADLILPANGSVTVIALTETSGRYVYPYRLSVTAATNNEGLLTVTRGTQWTAILFPETRVSFIEEGSALTIHAGSITLSRRAAISGVHAGGIEVALRGTQLRAAAPLAVAGTAHIELNEGLITYTLTNPPLVTLAVMTNADTAEVGAEAWEYRLDTSDNVTATIMIGCNAPSQRRNELLYTTECYGDIDIHFASGALVELKAQDETVTLSDGADEVTVISSVGMVEYDGDTYPFYPGDGFELTLITGAVTVSGEEYTEIILGEGDAVIGSAGDIRVIGGTVEFIGPDGTVTVDCGTPGMSSDLAACGGAVSFADTATLFNSRVGIARTLMIAPGGGSGDYRFELLPDGFLELLNQESGGTATLVLDRSHSAASEIFVLRAVDERNEEETVAPGTLAITSQVSPGLTFAETVPTEIRVEAGQARLVTLAITGNLDDVIYEAVSGFSPPDLLLQNSVIQIGSGFTSEQIIAVEVRAIDDVGDAADNPATVTGLFTINIVDSLAREEEEELAISVEFVNLQLSPPSLTRDIVSTRASGAFATITVTDGLEIYTYDLGAVTPSSAAGRFVINGSVISFTGGGLPSGQIIVPVTVSDSLSSAQIYTLKLNVYEEMGLVFAEKRELVLTGVTGSVAVLAISGGKAPYDTALIAGGGHFVLGATGERRVLSLASALAAPAFVTAVIRASDDSEATADTTATLILEAIEPLSVVWVEKPGRVVPGYTGVVNTITTSGGSGGVAFTKQSGAANIEISGAGVVNINPALAESGVYTVVFVVNDDESVGVTPAVSVTIWLTVATSVQFDDRIPGQVNTREGVTGEIYRPVVSGGVLPLRYVSVETLPDGLSLNEDSGGVTLMDDVAAGVKTVTLRVIDAEGESAVAVLTINIAALLEVGFEASSLNTVLLNTEVGVVKVADLVASGGYPAGYQYTVVGSNSYFAVDNAATDLNLMTLPVVATVITATVRVTDGEDSAGNRQTATAQLAVRILEPLVAGLIGAPTGRVDPGGLADAGQVTVGGGSGDAYAYRKLAGAAEVVIDSINGEISITPTSPLISLTAGVYTVSLVVDDDAGAIGSRLTEAASLVLQFTVASSIAFDKDTDAVTFNAGDTGVVYTPGYSGGFSPLEFSLLGTDPVDFEANLSVHAGNGEVAVTENDLTGQTVVATLGVKDSFDETAILILEITVISVTVDFVLASLLSRVLNSALPAKVADLAAVASDSSEVAYSLVEGESFFAVNDNILSLTVAGSDISGLTTLTAVVEGHSGVWSAEVTAVVEVLLPIELAIISYSDRVEVGYTGALGVIDSNGGGGGVRVRSALPNFVTFEDSVEDSGDRGVFSLASGSMQAAGVYSVTLIVDDSDADNAGITETPAATIKLGLTIASAVSVRVGEDSTRLSVGVEQEVYNIAALVGGGLGNYRYSLSSVTPGHFPDIISVGESDGRVTVDATGITVGTIGVVEIEVNDTVLPDKATLTLKIIIGDILALEITPSASGILAGYVAPLSLAVLAASGGVSPYTLALIDGSSHYFALDGEVLSVTAAIDKATVLTATVELSDTVGGDVSVDEFALYILASLSAELSGVPAGELRIDTANRSLGKIEASGGGQGGYEYRILSGESVDVGSDGGMTLAAGVVAGRQTVTLTVDDRGVGGALTAPVTVVLPLTVVELGLRFAETETVYQPTGFIGSVNTFNVVNTVGEVTLTLLSGSGDYFKVDKTTGELLLTANIVSATILTATLQATDEGGDAAVTAFAPVRLLAAVSVRLIDSLGRIEPGYSGIAGQITASGGSGDEYDYRKVSGDAVGVTIDAVSGEISITALTAGVYTEIFAADDRGIGSDLTPSASITLRFTVTVAVSLTGAEPAFVEVEAGDSGAVYILSAIGGAEAYRYTLSGTNPAEYLNDFTVDKIGGGVTLANAVTVVTLIVATLQVIDGFGEAAELKLTVDIVEPLLLALTGVRSSLMADLAPISVAHVEVSGNSNTPVPVNGSEDYFEVIGTALRFTADLTVAAILTATVQVTEGARTVVAEIPPLRVTEPLPTRLLWLDAGAPFIPDDSVPEILIQGGSESTDWQVFAGKPSPYVGGSHYEGLAAAQLGGTLWLFGGQRDFGDYQTNVWYYDLDAGGPWLSAAANYGETGDLEALAHRGSLYIFYSDNVYGSADGFNWEKLSDGSLPVRNAPTAISARDTMYLLSGEGDDDILTDVWRSLDGANWEAVNVEIPYGGWSTNHRRGAYLGGTLWLYGGEDGFDNQWYSVDGGVNWTSSIVPTPWGYANGMGLAVSNRKIYLVSNENSGQVWVSSDGENWEAAGAQPAGTGDYVRSILLPWVSSGDMISPPLSPALEFDLPVVTLLADTTPAALVSLAAVTKGGNGHYVYNLLSGADFFVLSGAENNILSLSVVLSVATVLLATVEVTDDAGATATAVLSLRVVESLAADFVLPAVELNLRTATRDTADIEVLSTNEKAAVTVVVAVLADPPAVLHDMSVVGLDPSHFMLRYLMTAGGYHHSVSP